MAEPLTQEIIGRAMRGDSDSFRVIVDQNQAFAYAVAYRFLANAEDAEDVTQEAFVRLWRNVHKYRPEIKLTTWLYRIVANLCLDFLKSAYGKQRKNQVDVDRIGEAKESTDEPLRQNELHEMILRAADGLTPKQKAVFVLRDMEDLPVEEVCSILSMSAGNVKSNLYYARQRVGEKLKSYYQTTDKITTI